MSGQKGLRVGISSIKRGRHGGIHPRPAESGAFIQMISQEGARQFELSDLAIRDGMIRAGRFGFQGRAATLSCLVSRREIAYGSFAPLCSDIMGPFRFLPMECRHGVLSMAHTLQGSVTMDGHLHRFDSGLGYAEKDSGISFPRSYLWMQCNDFQEPCSVMISIAHIQFCGSSFRGCICAVLYRSREYRLATYRGVKIQAFTPEHICLAQGSLLLELDIVPPHAGHTLRAPLCGRMSATIRESCNVPLRARLRKGGKTIFDLQSDHAAYEFVPNHGG
jgi:hypothetical protein